MAKLKGGKFTKKKKPYPKEDRNETPDSEKGIR